MTAQDKAKELLSKMNVIHYMKLRGKNKDSKGLPISMYDDQIKECALIAVDEILNCHIWKFNSVEPYKYWQEVKQELQKL